jgi:hypothetical protein
MSLSVLLFLFSCSFFSSRDISSHQVPEVVINPVEFTQSIDTLLSDVQVLWEKRGSSDRRQAQQQIYDFYEREANHIFTQLRDAHPQDVLAAEHQLGWVIHRLGRYTSRSFRREAGYLEKLSVKLKACSDLLPEPVPIIEEPIEGASLLEQTREEDSDSSLSAL